MLLGCCCPIEQSEMARGAGFDFIEPTVLSLQAADGTVDAGAVLSHYETSALDTSSFNIFLPADLSVCGPSVNWAAVEAYVREALRRVQAVGGKCVVFGSGAARLSPLGFDPSEAVAQLARFLRITGDIAAPLGITIVIEQERDEHD
jgi:D-psicose/D-tagatose/L-ribulose 3-epimerase